MSWRGPNPKIHYFLNPRGPQKTFLIWPEMTLKSQKMRFESEGVEKVAPRHLLQKCGNFNIGVCRIFCTSPLWPLFLSILRGLFFKKNTSRVLRPLFSKIGPFLQKCQKVARWVDRCQQKIYYRKKSRWSAAKSPSGNPILKSTYFSLRNHSDFCSKLAFFL